jgi:hypothetical protein
MDLSSNPNDADPILLCDDKWSSYYSSSVMSQTLTSTIEYTKVIVQTQTVYASTWTCSSTCGDVCYADVTTTSSSSYEITSISTSTDYLFAPFNVTTPSCSIPKSACSSIHSAWSSSVADYVKWEAGWWFPTEPPWPYSTPGCKYCDEQCYITASGNVQLFYWPVPETQTRDMCTNFPAKGLTNPWNFGNYSKTRKSTSILNQTNKHGT